MEKVIYVVHGLAEVDRRALGLDELAAQLAAAGAHRVVVHLADAHVAPAAGLRIAGPAPTADALVTVWVDSANPGRRAELDALVGRLGGTAAAYLVTESAPLPHPTADGPRGQVPGMAQVALLRRPEHLTPAAWLGAWLGDHTDVAIALQSTFAYEQNVVARALTIDAPAWDAVVEECFPAAAMTDPAAFFDVVDDPDALAGRQVQMIESVSRFLDLSQLQVIPMTRYELV